MSDSDVTLTVRLIRSFGHRNIKHIVYHNVNLHQRVADFRKFVDTDISTRSDLPPPFKKFIYDTLKISHKAYGTKATDPVINTDRDEELTLSDSKTLEQCGVESETEISYFLLKDYKEYQQNPTLVF